MVSTNDKKVKEAIRRNILSFYKGKGGLTQFVGEVDHYLRPGVRGWSTPEEVMYNFCQGPYFLFRSYEIEQFMKRLGFTDERRMEKYENRYGYGYDALYFMLVVREGAKMYRDYMTAHKGKVKTPRGY